MGRRFMPCRHGKEKKKHITCKGRVKIVSLFLSNVQLNIIPGNITKRVYNEVAGV